MVTFDLLTENRERREGLAVWSIGGVSLLILGCDRVDKFESATHTHTHTHTRNSHQEEIDFFYVFILSCFDDFKGC